MSSVSPTSFYGRKPSGIQRIQAPVLIKFADDDSDLCSSGGDSSDEENITDCELFLPIPSSSSEEVDSSDENADSNENQLLSILGRANGSAGKKEGATVVQATNKPNANGKKPAKKSQLLWKVKSLPNKQEDHKFKGNYQQKMDELLDCLGSELSYFYRIFPKELFQEIAYQTTLYSMQTNPEKPVAVKEEDIISFVACVLYMSVVKLPSTRDYWSSSIGIAHVANIMPVNRFEKLKSIIHFADNNSADKDDKLFKIRPLINKMNEQLNSIPFEENLAVDEQIIPFKGRHLIKQYNPKKPHKWGFIVFVLSGVSGFSYNFEVYCGGSDNICFENEPDLGASSNVVMRLARILPDDTNHKLYVDNWFNSIGLNVYMFKRGIQMVGTARSNRVGNCPVFFR
ncbi:piggyBac transposable element-derived protein 1-like [Hydra vulgaris]|uniref:piggyBac transposable element-derived protein 1-like n=1 Tax=Hydra vulgaris TaxID=6087 RepID=UPI0032EA6B19